MTDTSRQIRAEPTKQFFIDMLVRDIELIPAVGDLADNSIDGARRLRGQGPFTDLFIRISLDEEHFSIEDNCGGIPLDIAEKYAFRFGRPEGMEETPHSIGQFGVGMKRALFKLGSEFTVRSSTDRESFSMSVNVEEWRDLDEWAFEFDTYIVESDEEPGTRVAVETLHSETSSAFAQAAFVTRLARTLGAQHQASIEQGLVVTVNGEPVGGSAHKLLSSNLLSPATETLALFADTDAPVKIGMYVGVAERSHPPDAGWYVYCNGRLVLEADKSEVTGWGVNDEARFPQFHNRYGRFRGYVFFDSDDASKLPWTTTKTGLNPESAVYKRALQAMRLLGRPVAQFLYDLSTEIESPPEEEGTELSRIVEGASPAPLPASPPDSRFTFTRPPRPKRPKIAMQSIQYKRPIAEIEEAKDLLGVESASEVGQRTFDYFLKRERD